jgi:hypothetical protein
VPWEARQSRDYVDNLDVRARSGAQDIVEHGMIIATIVIIVLWCELVRPFGGTMVRESGCAHHHGRNLSKWEISLLSACLALAITTSVRTEPDRYDEWLHVPTRESFLTDGADHLPVSPTEVTHSSIATMVRCGVPEQARTLPSGIGLLDLTPRQVGVPRVDRVASREPGHLRSTDPVRS